MAKTIIALVGPIASGKGTVADILGEHGFEHVSFSDRIREEIKSRGMEVTRETLNLVSNELRETHGSEIWAKKTAKKISESDYDKFVVDGARNPAEIQFLKQTLGLKLIALTGDQRRRYELFIKRAVNSQPMTFEEFKDLDDKELNGSEGEHSQRVQDCMDMADFTVENNGTIEDLKAKVEEILTQISGPSQNRTGV